METTTNLTSVLKVLYRSRKQILGLTSMAGVLSIIITLMMPNYYKAATTFYAASPDMFTPEQMFGYGNQKTQVFGTDVDNDRLFSIANSSETINALIHEFNFYERYDKDSTKATQRYKTAERFIDNYDVLRTKYDAIQIEFESEDPQLSAAVANAARDRINHQAIDLIKRSQGMFIQTMESNIQQKSSDLDNMIDSVNHIKKANGIFNVTSQLEFLTEKLAETDTKLERTKATLDYYKTQTSVPQDTITKLNGIIRGLTQEKASLLGASGTGGLPQLRDAGPELLRLEDYILNANKQIVFDNERLKQLKSSYATDVQAIHIVEKASTPDFKSRPRRSIIVLASIMATFLFSLIAVLCIEAYRNVDWKSWSE